MTAEKDSKKPLLPKKRKVEDAPDFLYQPSDKYNWKVSEGDYVYEPVDDKGVPLITLPKRKK